MRLCHNQIVSVGEAVKSMLQEVLGPGVESGFNAEECDSEGILGLFGGLRDRLEVIDFLNYLMIVAILTVVDWALSLSCFMLWWHHLSDLLSRDA